MKHKYKNHWGLSGKVRERVQTDERFAFFVIPLPSGMHTRELEIKQPPWTMKGP